MIAIIQVFIYDEILIKKSTSHLGIEPRTFGLEVQRAIRCANGTTIIILDDRLKDTTQDLF